MEQTKILTRKLLSYADLQNSIKVQGKFLKKICNFEKMPVFLVTVIVITSKLIRRIEPWLCLKCEICSELENFDWALKFAGTDNPNRLNEIYLRKAEYYFRNGQFDDSADLYARTKASFEEIALKFIEIDKMSLKNYLCTKLSNLKSGEKAQITMLVMWIIQLYLSQIHLADEKDIISGTVDACRGTLQICIESFFPLKMNSLLEPSVSM